MFNLLFKLNPPRPPGTLMPWVFLQVVEALRNGGAVPVLVDILEGRAVRSGIVCAYLWPPPFRGHPSTVLAPQCCTHTHPKRALSR